MKSRIFPLIRKEFYHIWRDLRSLIIVILMPIVLILLYGYAITLDVKSIPIGVFDQNKTQASRELVGKFIHSGYFKVVAYPESLEQIKFLIEKRDIKAALVIPKEYSRNLKKKREIPVQLLVDGSESNVGTILINYARMILAAYSQELSVQKMRLPLEVQPRIWYNPNLTSVVFFVPGLVAIILMMISALLTSITIAREKETGTMEQILVSPIKPHEIILGKVLPYIFLAFLDGAIIFLVGKFWFQVPLEGNVVTLTLLAFVYIYAALSIGLFISTLARTQQIAMMAAMVSTMLPSIILSGFIFPIRSMPRALQYISYLVPAKYFLVIIRGIMLKGIGLVYLYPQVIFLFVFGSLLLLVSSVRFKTKLG